MFTGTDQPSANWTRLGILLLLLLLLYSTSAAPISAVRGLDGAFTSFPSYIFLARPELFAATQGVVSKTRGLPLRWGRVFMGLALFPDSEIRTTHRGLITPNPTELMILGGGLCILTVERWCNYSAFIKVSINIIINSPTLQQRSVSFCLMPC